MSQADGTLTGTLRDAILYLFQKYGAMTDEQLEQLPELKGEIPSSIRSRRAELVQLGHVVRLGLVTNDRNRRVSMYRAAGRYAYWFGASC